MKIPTRGEIVTALVTYRALGDGKPPSVAEIATPEQVAEYLAEVECGLRELEAEAWDEGVATALNYAKRQPDGITLKLETLDGGGWPNPYREGSDR